MTVRDLKRERTRRGSSHGVERGALVGP